MDDSVIKWFIGIFLALVLISILTGAPLFSTDSNECYSGLGCLE